MTRRLSISLLVLTSALGLGCGADATPSDAGAQRDGGAPADAAATRDQSTSDADMTDAGDAPDRGTPDAAATPDAAVTSDSGPTPDQGTLTLGNTLAKATFDAMFLHQGNAACEASHFTYEALIEAARDFPAFGTRGDATLRAREVAAFLANTSHETTGGWATAPDGPYAWGLCFAEEVGCGGGGCTGYCAASTEWPCASGQTYHGRGPMQLSWNYNYGQAGDALGSTC